MSKVKATGTTKLGRDSNPKYLGVKLSHGQKAKPGSIIVRQRGTKIKAGKNVRRGSDDTLYATEKGTVKFKTKKVTKYDNSRKKTKFVSVE
ncbi:MAG: 50S ribosomal protein L27 [Minisyncoccales bacterium]